MPRKPYSGHLDGLLETIPGAPQAEAKAKTMADKISAVSSNQCGHGQGNPLNCPECHPKRFPSNERNWLADVERTARSVKRQNQSGANRAVELDADEVLRLVAGYRRPVETEVSRLRKALRHCMSVMRYAPGDSNREGDAATDAAYNEAEALLAGIQDETTRRPPHWTCQTHGDFDAMRAVGCPECMRLARGALSRIAHGPPGALDNSEVAAWAADIARQVLWGGVSAVKAGETTPHAALLQEIAERHARVSKLLWGPGSARGTILGPMDSDAAHEDRGRLLSLLHLPPAPAEKASAEPKIGDKVTLTWSPPLGGEREGWTIAAVPTMGITYRLTHPNGSDVMIGREGFAVNGEGGR